MELNINQENFKKLYEHFLQDEDDDQAKESAIKKIKEQL